MKYIAIWGLVSIASSIVAGIVAALKNRDVSYWMGWCFVLPPMLIALLLISKLNEPRRRRQIENDDDDSV